MVKILIVEDDTSIASFLNVTLTAKGYITEHAATIHSALASFKNFTPDLVLLDLQLLDGNGESVLAIVRKWTQTPIIVISIVNDEETKVKLLDQGADDYITKPFSMGELLARIRVSLRKVKIDPPTIHWNSSGLTIDLEHKNILKNGSPIRLTPTEFQLLAILIKNMNSIVNYETLIESIWGEDAINEMNSLRVHINQIRKKIETDPQNPIHILTEPGVGYKWCSTLV